MADNDNLTPDEQSLFNDRAIEAAFQAWWQDMYPVEAKAGGTGDRYRKQFLMRIRFLIQQGKLP